MNIDWIFIFESVYISALVLICLMVIYDTSSNTKALAYLMAVIFVPVLGIVFYFCFGTNYRKNKLYSRKLLANDRQTGQLREMLIQESKQIMEGDNAILHRFRPIAAMLNKADHFAITGRNSVDILINGEDKFPLVIEALNNARHHIHIQYYIFEDDLIGRQIEEILKRKAQQGVEVRLIYDDFGSRSIRKRLVPALRSSGVQAFAFYRVIFLLLANRLNYRNHRKIIVVDGKLGFIGGINVSDAYINEAHMEVPSGRGKRGAKSMGKVRTNRAGTARVGSKALPAEKKLYWRDTHLRLQGPSVHYLQHLFLCDWNFCANDHLQPDGNYFPKTEVNSNGSKLVQIAASGPDSKNPTILFSLLQAVNLATKEILITTPYFIPEQSIIDALIMASMSGVDVKLLVPGVSDSKIVNAAARSYYMDLLDSGVEIYLYQKGFIHAKSLVVDSAVSIVGSANLDYRSFDLNFEANAIIYDDGIGESLRDTFFEDLLSSTQINKAIWKMRPGYKQFLEKLARLVSPLL